MVRGCANQGEAIKQSRAGKVWDQKDRKWIDKQDGAIIVDDGQFTEARKRHFGNAGGEASTSETAFPHYYELLGVEVRFMKPLGDCTSKLCAHPLQMRVLLLASRCKHHWHPGTSAWQLQQT